MKEMLLLSDMVQTIDLQKGPFVKKKGTGLLLVSFFLNLP